ncbi:MAG TPA: hypothetical protein VGX28_14485 [Frankiaceae bacterium]|jgi:hypothetical protein|nr:hypothetical protein [Frankiaceae bacterium]
MEGLRDGGSVVVARWTGRRYAAVRTLRRNGDEVDDDVAVRRRTRTGWASLGSSGSTVPLHAAPHPGEPRLAATAWFAPRCTVVEGEAAEARWVEVVKRRRARRQPVSGGYAVACGVAPFAVRLLDAEGRVLAATAVPRRGRPGR